MKIFKFLKHDAEGTRLLIGLGEFERVVKQDARGFAASYGLDPRWLDGAVAQEFDTTKSALVCVVISPPIQQISGALDTGDNPVLWRFQIPHGRWIKHPTVGGLTVTGLFALVVASDAKAAREVLLSSISDDASLRVAECAPEPMPVSVTIPGILVWAEN